MTKKNSVISVRMFEIIIG